MYDDLFYVFVKYMKRVSHANQGVTFVKDFRETLTEDERAYINAVAAVFYDGEKEYLDRVHKSMS